MKVVAYQSSVAQEIKPDKLSKLIRTLEAYRTKKKIFTNILNPWMLLPTFLFLEAFSSKVVLGSSRSSSRWEIRFIFHEAISCLFSVSSHTFSFVAQSQLLHIFQSKRFFDFSLFRIFSRSDESCEFYRFYFEFSQ